jgi:hypothetical protein
LRAKGVLVQTNDRRLPGRIVNGDDIEPAGAFANAPFRKEVLGGTSQEMLFARRDA